MLPLPEVPALSPDEIIRSDHCIGCGACTLTAADSAMRWDHDGFRKPAGAFASRKSVAVAARCFELLFPPSSGSQTTSRRC